MISKVDLISPANRELTQAVTYYDEQQPGLGDQFVSEFERTLLRIKLHPDAWPKLSDRSRRCRMKRFPYGVIYQFRDDRIIVLAVMHLHRKPGYWNNRED